MDSGTLLGGKYRLERLIGRGGMGSVWRAQHLGLSAPVAVKLLDLPGTNSAGPHPELPQSAIRRFKSEAQAAANIRSPHVVQILEYGVDEALGAPFIVMELLEGESLAQRLARTERLTHAETTQVVTHVGRALSRVHDAGMVHRDLKPGNVFLVTNEDDFVAKVLDFGIAKADQTGDGSHMLTSTGDVIGTAYYMSPEQLRGSKDVDFRTDLWALGVLACQCLTGRLPFHGATLADLTMKICAEPVPLPSSLAAIPAGFDGWFLRSVERDPNARFGSAREAAEQLRALLPTGPDRYSVAGAPASTARFASHSPSTEPLPSEGPSTEPLPSEGPPAAPLPSEGPPTASLDSQSIVVVPSDLQYVTEAPNATNGGQTARLPQSERGVWPSTSAPVTSSKPAKAAVSGGAVSGFASLSTMSRRVLVGGVLTFALVAASAVFWGRDTASGEAPTREVAASNEGIGDESAGSEAANAASGSTRAGAATDSVTEPSGVSPDTANTAALDEVNPVTGGATPQTRGYDAGAERAVNAVEPTAAQPPAPAAASAVSVPIAAQRAQGRGPVVAKPVVAPKPVAAPKPGTAPRPGSTAKPGGLPKEWLDVLGNGGRE